MRLADARLAASTMMSCSMIESLMGSAWLWMMNTSQPRTDSSKRQWISPLANRWMLGSPSSMPRCAATAWASAGCEVPLYIRSCFLANSSFLATSSIDAPSAQGAA